MLRLLRPSISLVAVALAVSSLAGCAGMIVGTHDWFERKKPDVQEKASVDLSCKGQPIDFVAASGDDYREVEARGCAKKVRYKLVKVSVVESWVKSSEVQPM